MTSSHRIAPSWQGQFGRLAIANILSNLLVPLAGLIDTAFLGHLADIKHLAGVALATVIFNIVYWSFGFLRMGTTGTTAQAVGRGDAAGVLLTGLRSSLLALLFGLSLLVLQEPIADLGFWLLQAPADVLAAGRAFYHAKIWGAPAVLLNYVLLGWFLGQGLGRPVLLLALVGNGVNIGLDYLFVVRLGWGSSGAGGATALSEYAMVLVGLGICSRRVRWSSLQPLLPQLADWPALRGFASLNRDILIRTFALVLSFALFTQFSATMGATVLAANTLLLQVFTLAAYLIDGFAFATESLAGMLQGQQDLQGLRRLVVLSGGSSVGVGSLFALLFALMPGPLFGLLTHHGTVITAVERYVWWLVPVLGWVAIAFMLDGYFLGLTAGHTLRNSTVIASLCGFLPTSLLAWHWGNPHLLWLAMSLFMATRALTLGRHVPTTWH